MALLPLVLPLGLIGVGMWMVAGWWSLVTVGGLIWLDNYRK